MTALDDLTAQVAATVGVEQSAVTLITGLAADLAAAVASSNTAAISALSAQLSQSANTLAAAITSNPLPPTAQTTPTP